MRFRFREFVLDTQRQELCRTGIEIPLEPKAYQVLHYLLMHQDQALSKEDLLDACWTGENVSDSAITRCLRVIRQAVDDDGLQQHTIKTLRRFGYRFIAPVTVSPQSADKIEDQTKRQLTESTTSEFSDSPSLDIDAGETPGTRHALLIGNGQYPFAPDLPDLRTPEQDVVGLAEVLTHPQIARFQKVEQLLNESHRDVLDRILRLLQTVQKHDLVLIYFSGHARLDAQGSLYLACTNTQSSVIETTALALRQIKDAIDTCQSTRILLIFDCCFRTVTGDAVDSVKLEDGMRWIASGRGKYILCSSPVPQNVQDRQTDRYSLLTKHLIEGLSTGDADLDHAGIITVDQLYQYTVSKGLEEAHAGPLRWEKNHVLRPHDGKDTLRLDRTQHQRARVIFQSYTEPAQDVHSKQTIKPQHGWEVDH